MNFLNQGNLEKIVKKNVGAILNYQLISKAKGSFLENKIEGLPILKLAMIKKVKKFVQKSVEKIRPKNSSKQFVKKIPQKNPQIPLTNLSIFSLNQGLWATNLGS